MNEQINKYALLNCQREFSSPEDKEGTLTFQPVTFYERFEDGTYENGTTLEELLSVGIKRLKDLNERFSFREHSIAITKMEEALMWLNKRTEDRIVRGVEGKHLI